MHILVITSFVGSKWFWQSIFIVLTLILSTVVKSDATVDTDADGMPDYWERKYGLNPQNPNDSSSDQDADGFNALNEYINNTVPSGTLDIDGNGQKDALSDGVLIIRYLFGLRNSSLIANALSSDAVFTSSEQVEARIIALGDLLDVDQNGGLDALTDGLMTLRFLFGIENESLVERAIATNSIRSQLQEIKQHFIQLIPKDSDLDGVYDVFDIFPNDPQEIGDFDEDTLGNNADPDDDNDGIADTQDTQFTPPLSLDRLQTDTFNYFWQTTDPQTGLVPDRYPTSWSPSSIAAIGFALTSYPVGVERAYISRQEAINRTLNTLNFLWQLPMGDASEGVAGYQGFFYHFLGMDDGLRMEEWNVELSTVDTALLMAGVLFAQSYYSQDTPEEQQIRTLANQLYRRVNWQWAQNNSPLISHGWRPNEGFISYDWAGYNEAMLVYILALGSPTYKVEPNAWTAWTNSYDDDWGFSNGIEHLTMAPLFGHQYSHVWIDFRDIQDQYMATKNSDYFKNSTQAVYAQQQYAINNPQQWLDYSEHVWGLTACDGPGNFNLPYNSETRSFRGYSARGTGINYSFDDGTIAPTAVGGSLPFAPQITIQTLQTIYADYGEHLYGEYGFLDSFNPSFDFDIQPTAGQIIAGKGWFGTDYIGIDQGPILLMTENLRSEMIWNVMKTNPYIRLGLQRAGFSGGWLADQ
jgi:hypothetical protein